VAVHAEINDVMLRLFGRVPHRWLANYAFAEADATAGPARSRLRRLLAALRPCLWARRRWKST
jgi:hypothetical protein